jgi:3D (Asp-Asp-Asp) domain-containing protein
MPLSIIKNRLLRFFIFILLLELSCFYRPVIKESGEKPETRLLHLDITKSDVVPEENRQYLGKFKVTFYWIVEESIYSGNKTTPIFLENGKVLGYFPAKFVADLKKEGCAELKDGRRISYLKKVNKVRIVNDFMGYGGYSIKPFVSVATDPNVIPTGSKLYIPQLTKIDRAVLVAGDGVEDQCVVYAHDIGAMVNNHHIDFFVGYKKNIKLFNDAGIESAGLVDVYLVE